MRNIGKQSRRLVKCFKDLIFVRPRVFPLGHWIIKNQDSILAFLFVIEKPIYFSLIAKVILVLCAKVVSADPCAIVPGSLHCIVTITTQGSAHATLCSTRTTLLIAVKKKLVDAFQKGRPVYHVDPNTIGHISMLARANSCYGVDHRGLKF